MGKKTKKFLIICGIVVGAGLLLTIIGAAAGGISSIDKLATRYTWIAGPLTGVQLGLRVYHVCEPEVKAEFDPDVYSEQVEMMEMVLDVDDIVNEMTSVREQYCKY